MSKEQSALAAAGFHLPPDPEEMQRRQLALKLAVEVCIDEISDVGSDTEAIVATAESFLAFLNGKPANTKE